MEKVNNKRIGSRSRKGFNMIELSFGFIIIGLALAAVFAAANKFMTSQKADNVVSSVQSTMTALETIKTDNAGAYLTSAGGLINANLKITNAMGGALNMKDVAGYTYVCATGAASTITIVTGQIDSAAVQLSAVDKINGKFPTWTATPTGTAAAPTITLTKTANCQVLL
jgi:type II secretory pathway pseudopilin PulG